MTKSFIKKVTTTQKKKTPRTHQFEAILSVVKGFEKNRSWATNNGMWNWKNSYFTMDKRET